MRRRGSALIVALWVIAALSVMVLSFATEAHLHAGINVYVRERNRVGRLIDAGQTLAEVVLVKFTEVSDWSEGENLAELLEEDRWVLEKRELKNSSKCTIGPILVDEEHPESGTVKVEIELVNAGEKNAINVNELYEGAQSGGSNSRLRWEMLFQSHGLPLDYEVRTDDGTFVLADLLIASWNDWRDEDDTAMAIDGKECGAEREWYEEHYDELKTNDEDRRYPRNGSIPDIKELSYVRGWRDYPAILTGGVLNPEDNKEEQISVTGLADMLGVSGGTQVNPNSCTLEQLLSVPGIFDESEDDDLEMAESREVATAIIACRTIMPDYDVDETRTWWPYKDFADLSQRVSDEFSVVVGNEANDYLVFTPTQDSIFKLHIEGESMGMKREVRAEAYVNDGKVRYVRWSED